MWVTNPITKILDKIIRNWIKEEFKTSEEEWLPAPKPATPFTCSETFTGEIPWKKEGDTFGFHWFRKILR